MNATLWTINEIKDAVRATGSHWFDPDTMRFFGTKVLNSSVYNGPGGIYFVTSEWDGFSGKDEGKRAYTVRKFIPDTAQIDTVGNICQYKDADEAVDEAASLASNDGEGGEVVREQFEPITEAAQLLHDCRKHGNPETHASVTKSLLALGAEHHKLMEDYCNGVGKQFNQNGDPTGRLKNVRAYIEANAQAAGAKGVHFSGDPRDVTVKLIWNNGETNDFGKDGWCVPGA